MRKNIKYIATALILVLAASCNKIDEKFSGESLIRFAPQSVGTKATVDVKADLQDQTFAVVGLLDNAANFQNTISYSGGSWIYGTAADYMWKSGTHTFFGYTNEAGSLSNNKLSVSKTLTTSSDKMSDLLYSNVFTSTAVAWKAAHEGQALDSPVPLYFHHMLSAVSIIIKNCTENPVTINSVSAPIIPNKGSAEIDFTSVDADGKPTPTFGDVTIDGNFVTADPISEAMTLPAGEMIDVLTMASVAESDTAAAYQVVWPQTLAEDAVTVAVNYTMNNKSYSCNVSIPADTWVVGNKYSYILQVLPTDVRLIFNVQPWESVSVTDVNDTSTGSINMSNVTWQNTKVKLTENGAEQNTLSIAGFSVYMYKDVYVKNVNTDVWELKEGYYPAQAYFTVNYPLEGKFKIGLIPAYGETQVDTTKYEIWIYDEILSTPAFRAIDPAGEDLSGWRDDNGVNTIYFQVRASSSVPDSHSGYKAQVDIWFMPEGSDEWISAYSEIRANYACVIPATN